MDTNILFFRIKKARVEFHIETALDKISIVLLYCRRQKPPKRLTRCLRYKLLKIIPTVYAPIIVDFAM